MSKSLTVVVIAAAVAIACGIKGPPRAPSEQPAPPPVQSTPQTPMTQELDAGCTSCAERGP